MKIRNGFVSNSSSSSFIVGIPKMPTSPENLEIMMFGCSEEVQPYDFCPATSTLDVAKRVFADINHKDVKKYTKTKLIKALVEEHGSFPGCPRSWYWDKNKESHKIEEAYEKETGKEVWDENSDPKVRKHWKMIKDAEEKQEKKEMKIAATAFVEGFWPRVKGMKVFDLSYADDGGEGNLEHGDIFRKFPHIRISHH